MRTWHKLLFLPEDNMAIEMIELGQDHIIQERSNNLRRVTKIL